MGEMGQRGPYLIAASYDLTISVTDLAADANSVAAPPKFGLQSAQANRIIGYLGSRFAVASNPSIFIYERGSKLNKPVITFQGHQSNVTDLCAVNGPRIYSCSEDESWRTWDYPQVRSVGQVATGTCLNAIRLIADDKILVTGNDRGQLDLWSTTDSNRIFQAKVAPSEIRSIALIGDEGKAVVGCLDGTLVVVQFEGTSVRVLATFQGHKGACTQVNASPDGKMFCSCGQDSRAVIWDVDTIGCKEGCQMKRELKDKGQTRWIWGCAFTPDSMQLCAGGTDKICRIWDVETGALRRTIEWHQKGITCIAVVQ
jgi:G protein beta subunit-like protein